MGFWNDFVEDIGDAFNEITESESVKEVVTTGAKWAGAGLLVGATGGLGALALGGAVAAEGCLLKKAAEGAAEEGLITEDGFLKRAADFTGDACLRTGFGKMTGSLLGTGNSSIASMVGEKALKAGISASTTTGSKALVNSWLCAKAAQYGFDACSTSKNYWEGVCSFLHGKHKDEGIHYESNCPICNGTFDKMFFL